MSESYELGRTDCESLLRAGVVGRAPVAAPDGPHTLPINYSVVDNAIVVRTSPYSLLGAHGMDAMLAFEVDQFDYEYLRGWGVMARGRSEEVHDPDELEHIRSVSSPHPWASGVRPLFLRLRWLGLTGRWRGAGGTRSTNCRCAASSEGPSSRPAFQCAGFEACRDLPRREPRGSRDLWPTQTGRSALTGGVPGARTSW